MKTYSISDARAKLSQLVEAVDEGFERVLFTKSGKAKAVLMSSEEFDSWMETLDILADRATMRKLRRAEQDVVAGKIVNRETVLAGRP
jgi:antitoxin YefM